MSVLEINSLQNKVDPEDLKTAINGWLFRETEGVVQTGPFKGMKMLRDEHWPDGNLGTKLLGCYEQELHPKIEEYIAALEKMDKPIVLDIGCAEGYYLIGLALRLPRARVIGLDISIPSIDIARRAAELNGVEVEFNSTGFNPDFILCDCEGGEVFYLDPGRFPLEKTTIVVECHDSDSDLQVSNAMITRFGQTHEIFYVEEGERNPNKFPMLRGQKSAIRWMAMSEGRPCTMHWFVMEPKQ